MFLNKSANYFTLLWINFLYKRKSMIPCEIFTSISPYLISEGRRNISRLRRSQGRNLDLGQICYRIWTNVKMDGLIFSASFRVVALKLTELIRYGLPYMRVQVLDFDPNLTRSEAKAIRLRDGWQVSGWSTNSLDCLPSKWYYSESGFPTDSHARPRTQSTRGGNDELEPNTTDFRVDHHLWRDCMFIKTFLFLSPNWLLAWE